jgi:hypothetical protein
VVGLHEEHAIKAISHAFSRFPTVREPFKQVFHRDPVYMKATEWPVMRLAASEPMMQTTIVMEHWISTNLKSIAKTNFVEHCWVMVVSIKVPV